MTRHAGLALAAGVKTFGDWRVMDKVYLQSYFVSKRPSDVGDSAGLPHLGPSVWIGRVQYHDCFLRNGEVSQAELLLSARGSRAEGEASECESKFRGGIGCLKTCLAMPGLHRRIPMKVRIRQLDKREI